MKKRLLATIPVLLVVFLCSYNVHADTLPTAGAQTAEQKYLNDDLIVYVSSRVFKPNLLDYDFMSLVDREYSGTTNNPYPWNGVNTFNESMSYTFEEQVIFNINLRNEGDYLAFSDTDFISILPNFTFSPSRTPQGFFIENLSDDFTVYNLMANGEIRLKPVNQRYSYLGVIGIPKDTNTTISFIVHFLYYGGEGDYSAGGSSGTSGGDMYNYDPSTTMISVSSINVSYPTNFSLSNVNTSSNDILTFWRIDQWLDTIAHKLNRDDTSYNDVQSQSAGVESDSSSLETQSDTIHTQETGYYTQVNTALTSTGLNNFTFGTNEVSGINIAKGHFMLIWNILDDYKNVFIFSMTLSLALMIIRHIRPIKRKKEEAS